jgi:hypothetical protein
MSNRDPHAEIKRRYARRFQQQPLPQRLSAMARAEIRRLVRYRIRSKATSTEQYIIRMLGTDWKSCSGHELANRVLALRLTLKERMLLDIRRFPATDVSRTEQTRAYASRRRAAHRERERARRRRTTTMMEATMKTSDLSIRKETLYYLLKQTGRWTDVRSLVEAVKDFEAWQRQGGSRMTPKSLKGRVHETLNLLVAEGAIKQKNGIAKRGLKRLVKWSENKRTSVLAYGKRVRTKKDPHKTGTSEPLGQQTVPRAHTFLIGCAHESGERPLSRPNSDTEFKLFASSTSTKH